MLIPIIQNISYDSQQKQAMEVLWNVWENSAIIGKEVTSFPGALVIKECWKKGLIQLTITGDMYEFKPE